MTIPLHYLPKFYDNSYTVTTESLHNIWVLLIVMTVDCLRLFTQSAQFISLLWLEMARIDSPAFIEKNSLAVCENMKIGLPDRRTIRSNGHGFRRWKKFDRTREKMYSCTCIDFLPNLHGSCLTWCEKVTF